MRLLTRRHRLLFARHTADGRDRKTSTSAFSVETRAPYLVQNERAPPNSYTTHAQDVPSASRIRKTCRVGRTRHAMEHTRRMQCIVGERERPNLTCWVVKKPSTHVKETPKRLDPKAISVGETVDLPIIYACTVQLYSKYKMKLFISLPLERNFQVNLLWCVVQHRGRENNIERWPIPCSLALAVVCNYL